VVCLFLCLFECFFGDGLAGVLCCVSEPVESELGVFGGGCEVGECFVV
jgi:hypothetical protein